MLTQSTTYAIRALAGMEGPSGEYRLVKSIAKDANIPSSFLSKIIGILQKKGLVRTRRGMRGGVKASREPVEVNVLEVCKALRDPVLEMTCLLGYQECRKVEKCGWQHHELALQKTLEEYLESVSVKNVAKMHEIVEAMDRPMSNRIPEGVPA